MMTIFGSSGFIGSHIVKLLQKNNIEIYTPSRDVLLNNANLGDIIYSIGLTSDFRSKPFETVEAHITKLANILQYCTFSSLTYLSSARVYINCGSSEVSEDSIIPVNPLDSDELYTLTKLTGERLCLSSGKKIKIIRLSNVYGYDLTSENFLTDVIKKIIHNKKVSFKVLPSSAKDYIHINDAADLIVRIARDGHDRIYNVASGYNTSNAGIIAEIRKHIEFDVDLSGADKAVIFPVINIDKIKHEFNYTPGNITTFIPKLLNCYNNVSN